MIVCLAALWRALAGASAGATATILTYPLDLVRAKLAVQDTKSPSRGIAGTISHILKSEGGAGLFRGIRPTLSAVAPFVAVQQSAYDVLKLSAFEAGAEPSIHLFLGCGTIAGALAQACVHPIDVIRRRAQVDGANKKQHQGWVESLLSLSRKGLGEAFVGLWQTCSEDLT